jgi:hypothetical protein
MSAAGVAVQSDRESRIWRQIAQSSAGSPVNVAHVCEAAVTGVGVDGAAVVVVTGPTVRDTVHATNRVAGELEEWQLTFGQGPCVDAYASGGPVMIANLDSPDHSKTWPVFTPAALGSGARAVFALPIQIGAIRLGVLDLYRTRPGPLDATGLADALAFADAAGALLLDAAAGIQPDTEDMAWQLDDPTAHHAQVHQATGMILVQLGVTAEAAFARLRAHAFAHERRLGDVARDVISRRLRFAPDPVSGGNVEE